MHQARSTVMTSSYASSIRTVTDMAGNSYGVWNENGQLLMARWDQQAGRWDEAAQISDAVNGQNVQLVAANLPKDKSGRTTPVLAASWESGQGNEADVYMALGFYRNNGEIQWSDSIRLERANQQEREHRLGTASVDGTDWLLVAAESQVLNDPDGAVGLDRSGAEYNDSEIGTMRIQVVQTGTANGQTIFNGGTVSIPKLTSGAQEVVSALVNGRSVELGQPTRLVGVGTVTVNRDGTASFNRNGESGELNSEVLISADLVNQSGGTVSRTSHTILSQALLDRKTAGGDSINGLYQLRVYNDSNLDYSTLPVTFTKTDNRERVTRSTFSAPIPHRSGFSLRDYTGTSPLSDTSLRGMALKAQSDLRSSALLNIEGNP